MAGPPTRLVEAVTQRAAHFVQPVVIGSHRVREGHVIADAVDIDGAVADIGDQSAEIVTNADHAGCSKADIVARGDSHASR